MAREFVASGDWLVCRLNGATYAHKPPGFFWAAAVANVLFGASWTTAAKIPSVLGGAVAAALVFDLARRSWGRVAGLAAALALISAKEFYTISCRGNLDGFLNLWTTLAAYAFVRATLGDPGERARTAWTAAGFLAAGLGLMVKGPVAFLVPGVAALVALVWDDRWAAVPAWRWAAGCVVLAVPLPLPGPVSWAVRVTGFVLLTGFARSRWGALATWRWSLAPLALLPAVVWAVAAAGRAPEGWGYLRDLALGHGVAHAAGQVDKLEPWWFYLKAFPLGLLPWAPLLPAAFWAWSRHAAPARRGADRFAMAWLVAPFVAMSLSPAKRDLYLVPLAAPAALLAGRLVACIAADPSRLHVAVVRRGVQACGAVIAAAAAILLAFAAVTLLGGDDLVRRVRGEWADSAAAVPDATIWAALVLGAALAAPAVVLLRARTATAAARSAVVSVPAMVLGAALVYAPFTEAALSHRAFVEEVGRRVGDAWLGDYGGADFGPNWVLGRRVVPGVTTRTDAEDVLASQPGPVYFLVDRERLSEKGMPAGAAQIAEDVRRGPRGLVLLGRN